MLKCKIDEGGRYWSRSFWYFSGLVSFKKNWDVELLEKEDYVGGLGSSREKTYLGQSVFLDSGPHIFHTNDEEMIQIWKKSFSDSLSRKNSFAANCKGDDYTDFHDYPISKEGLEKKNINVAKIDNKINPFLFSNYRDYMQARVGEVIEQEYFREYPKKLWGINTYEMRADWAPKRIEIRKNIEPFFVNQWVATSKYGSGYIYNQMKMIF